MIRTGVFAGILVALVFAQIAFTQDVGVRDTLTFGEDGMAFVYPGDNVRLPVYFSTDSQILGLGACIEFSNASSGMVFDSVSKVGTIFDLGNYLDLTSGFVTHLSADGLPPDTLCFGGAALNNYLPPGSYRLCNLWFSGGNIGDIMVIDTTFLPPANKNTVVLAGDGGAYVPEMIFGNITLVEGRPEIFVDVPSPVEAIPGEVLSFQASAVVYYPPTNIVLDSLVRVGSDVPPQNAPVTYGSNPLVFIWQPNPYEGNTVWHAYFTVTDGIGYSSSAAVEIDVIGGGAYWGVIGDANCDDIVDIDDIMFLINYVFKGGPVPKCE